MRWGAHPWKRRLPKRPGKELPEIDGKRVMGSDLKRAAAVREHMLELEKDREARRELQRQQDASNAQNYFGRDRFHAAPPDTQPPTVPQNLTGQAVSAAQVTLNWTAPQKQLPWYVLFMFELLVDTRQKPRFGLDGASIGTQRWRAFAETPRFLTGNPWMHCRTS